MFRRSSLLIFILFFAVQSATKAAAQDADPVSTLEALQQLRATFEAAARDDCVTALKLGTPLVDGTQNKFLDDEAKVIAYNAVLSCELKGTDADKAYPHLLAATALKQPYEWFWQSRLRFEMGDSKLEQAVVTIETMGRRDLEALNSMPMALYWKLIRDLDKAPKTDLKLRVLGVLGSNTYTPTLVFSSPDGFRLSYAEALFDKGDKETAKALVIRLSDPTTIEQASLDARFRDFFPERIEMKSAFEKQLAVDQATLRLHADLLEAYANVAHDFLRLGRPQNALDVLFTAKPHIGTAGFYRDQADYLNWWWDVVGRSYVMLGKFDDARDAFANGVKADETGTLNVSQVINLATMQMKFGHSAAALETLAVFADEKREASPYGQSEMRMVRGCANALLGRVTEVAADLTYLREHEGDHPEALSDLFLCQNDMEGAAAAFIRRLDDPNRRALALLQLSDYPAAPVILPADPIRSRYPVLKARTDVKAAIERAGGTRRFDVQPADM